MTKKDVVVNQKNGLSVKTSSSGHCKSTGIIYAIHCKKCKLRPVKMDMRNDKARHFPVEINHNIDTNPQKKFPKIPLSGNWFFGLIFAKKTKKITDFLGNSYLA